MIQVFFRRASCHFACILIGLVGTRPAPAQTLPASVTTISSFPHPAPDAFSTSLRFGPDALIYAWDGQQVWQQSGVNMDSFGATAFGTVPSNGADAGPINFSQNGQTILIGNGSGGIDSGSNGMLFKMPSSGGAATPVGTVASHFDFVPAPAASTMPSSGTKFIVNAGSADFATSRVDVFDYATGQTAPLIQNIPGASSSIAFDSANRLYVGVGFGNVQGQIRRFTLPQLDLATIGHPLDWTSGQLFNSADNNSGSGMFFDARGNLFVGGPNGVAVFNAAGASQLYNTGTGSFPAVSRNATNDQFALTLGGFNDPLHLGSSPIIYNAADFNVPAPPASAWNGNAGGNWSDGSHWDRAVAPNGIDQRAVLGGNVSTPQFIQLYIPVTLGALTINSPQEYLVSGPAGLTMQVSSTIAAINIAGGSHVIGAAVVLASDTDVTVTNSVDALTVSDGISGSGMLSKEGSGVLIVTGANTYSGNTAIDGGRMRFAINAGTPTVGIGATVTIAPGATLELAGAVSALGAAGGNRARVVNDSVAAGLVVSGVSQVVGDVDGAGLTSIDSGGDLTADHIIQSNLVLGGSSTSLARLTIAASDSMGNSLISKAEAMALADSILPRGPFGEGIDSAAAIAELEAVTFVDRLSLTSKNGVGLDGVAVPEPHSIIMAIVALVAGTMFCCIRRPTLVV